MPYYPGRDSLKNGRCCNCIWFQLWKTGQHRSITYFHNRVNLCYEIRDKLICTLHNGQLDAVYVDTNLFIPGKGGET